MRNLSLLTFLILFILTACHSTPAENQQQTTQPKENPQNKKKVNTQDFLKEIGKKLAELMA